jgi:hypothetical protein
VLPINSHYEFIAQSSATGEWAQQSFAVDVIKQSPPDKTSVDPVQPTDSVDAVPTLHIYAVNGDSQEEVTQGGEYHAQTFRAEGIAPAWSTFQINEGLSYGDHTLIVAHTVTADATGHWSVDLADGAQYGLGTPVSRDVSINFDGTLSSTIVFNIDTNPVQPGDPSQPGEPVDPTLPVDPSEPGEPVDPTDPVPPQPTPVQVTIDGIVDRSSGAGQEVAQGGTSGDFNPLIYGHSIPFASVTVTDQLSGNVIGTVQADQYGNWKVSSEIFADGHYQLVASSYYFTSEPFVLDVAHTNVNPLDPALQPPSTGEVSIVGVLDRGGDQVHRVESGSTVHGGNSSDTFMRVFGHADPGTAVFVYKVVDGELTFVSRVMADEHGIWQLGIVPFQTHYDFIVSPQGRVPNPAVDPIFSVDVIPQSAESVSLPLAITAAYDHEGALSSGAISDTTLPVLQGTGINGCSIAIYDGDQRLGLVLADNTGHWELSSLPLTPGQHTLTLHYGDQVSEPFVLTVVPGGIHAADVSTAIQDASAQQDILVADAEDQSQHSVPAASPQDAVTLHVADPSGDASHGLANGDVSGTNRPVLSGHAQPYAWVDVYDDVSGKIVAYAQADANGHWDASKDVRSLDNGHYELVAKTALGSSDVFSLDVAHQAPPSLTEPAPLAITAAYDHEGASLISGSVSDTGQPVLQGTAGMGGCIVTLYDGNTKLAQVFTDASGHWQFNPSAWDANGKQLSVGEHSLTVHFGEQVSAPFELMVQPAAAASLVSATLPEEAVHVASSQDFVSLDAVYLAAGATQQIPPGSTLIPAKAFLPEFSGSASPFSHVTLYDQVSGKAVAFGQADAEGHWQTASVNPIGNGSHVFYAQLSDGNVFSDLYSFNVNHAPSQFTSNTSEAVDEVHSASTLSLHDVLSNSDANLFAAKASQPEGKATLSAVDVESQFAEAPQHASHAPVEVSSAEVTALHNHLLPQEHAHHA